MKRTKRLIEDLITTVLFVCTLMIIIVMCSGCRVEQVQRIEGQAQASIIQEFPLAERCFDDTRIHTWDELKVCLELTTNMKYTVDVEGNVTEAMIDVPLEDLVE